MFSDKKEVKRLILGRFRTMGPKSDYILPRRWVEDYCLRKTEPAARPVVEEAVCDLVSLGILAEIHRGMGRLELTDMGAKLILRD